MERLEYDLSTIVNALGMESINQVQQLVAEKGLFDSDKNLALVSMSRTGKSFAGLLFVANELFRIINNRVTDDSTESTAIGIIVTPFHASARDTLSVISRYFGWFLRPVIIIDDKRLQSLCMRLNDQVRPNVIIATPEAARNLIRSDEGRTWLADHTVACVVYDDVHAVLHDPDRGTALLELDYYFSHVITPSPRRLVISAMFDEPHRLESLFDVQLVIDNTEYSQPEITLEKYSTTQEKEKRLRELVRQLVEAGNPTLVYMNSIESINEFVSANGKELSRIASIEMDPLVRGRLQRIARVLDTLDYKGAEFVAGGIAYYHGLMDATQRSIIEWALRRKYLSLIIGTESMGFGINTPVSNVVMSSPGIDEVFRQSMMARAVRLRRGRIQPGACTVFTKSISDVKDLQRVYRSPSLPLRFASAAVLSRLLIGLIGHGILCTESDRVVLSERLGLLYKKQSTEVILQSLIDARPPLVSKALDDTLSLTPLGQIAFQSGLSGPQTCVIMQALSWLDSSKQPITDMDLLIIMCKAITEGSEGSDARHAMRERIHTLLMGQCKCALSEFIVGTEHEKQWARAVEYAILLQASRTDIELPSRGRKTPERLEAELRVFLPHFLEFLKLLLSMNSPTRSTDRRRGTKKSAIDRLLALIDDVFDNPTPKQSHMSQWSLDFIDFSDIEHSIDAVLDSDLPATHKIQVIELLESVNTTTSALVDLVSRSKDDSASYDVLAKVCTFSRMGRLGDNLVRALDNEGLIQPGAATELWRRFSSLVDQVKKRTDMPAKAAGILFSLFSGNLVGAVTSGYGMMRIVVGKSKGRVDTSALG